MWARARARNELRAGRPRRPQLRLVDQEGTNNFSNKTPAYTPFVDPIHDYSHSLGLSLTGGFVYRGTNLGASTRGRYFFADYVTCRVWSLPLTILPSGEAQAVDAGAVTEHTVELRRGRHHRHQHAVQRLRQHRVDRFRRARRNLSGQPLQGDDLQGLARRRHRRSAGRLGDAVRTQSGVVREYRWADGRSR